MPQTPATFNPQDYLTGRVLLPPSVYAKRQYPFFYAGQITIAQDVTSILSILMDPDAHFLCEGISIVPGNNTAYENAFVQITDASRGTPWSNATVNLRDIAGKGDSPKYLSDPQIVSPSATLQIAITNSIAATVTYYVVLHGRKIYDLSDAEATFLSKRMWFQYVMTLPTMTNGQLNQTTVLQIFNQSSFTIKKLLSTDIIHFVLSATAGTESAEILMQLKDAVTDQNFFSQRLAARLVVGSYYSNFASGNNYTNAEPFCLRKPIVIQANGSLQGTFANRSVTTATGLKLTLEGTRVFPL